MRKFRHRVKWSPPSCSQMLKSASILIKLQLQTAEFQRADCCEEVDNLGHGIYRSHLVLYPILYCRGAKATLKQKKNKIVEVTLTILEALF